MKDILEKLVRKESLTKNDISRIVESIAENSFSEVQLAGILTALQLKNINSEELSYFANKFLERASVSKAKGIDICGTGGDYSNTFNISTAASFVIAGAGIKVAKHGNRAVSSNSGSFDVLDELGIVNEIDEIKFLYARDYHPAFKNIAELRKKLGIKTIFNLLGPLINPANITGRVIGVHEEGLIECVAETLDKLGTKRAMVVNGRGLDEITITGNTKVAELDHGQITNYLIDPRNYGMQYGKLEDIRVKNSRESALVILDVLKNKNSFARDIVLLNAAAGIYVAGKSRNYAEAIESAKDSISSGKAYELLRRMQK